PSSKIMARFLRLTVTTLWFMMYFFSCRADYSPLPLHYMILNADLALFGEIIAADEKTFTLKIEGEAFGDYNGAQITVKRFSDWTCAWRWTEYAEGQKVFLFLNRQEDGDWEIMSAGGEGEMPVHNGKVYLSGYYGYTMPFVDYIRIDTTGKDHHYNHQAYELYGAVYQGVELNLEEFRDAVSRIRSCFIYKKGNKAPDDRIETNCTKDDLIGIRERSKLHNWLVDKCVEIK
ncbi:MAG: hypothetical protein KJ607_02445, partial [Bacteroidetes bacterium]|nr:hypothetical protein [Bacteroidota bacterium]